MKLRQAVDEAGGMERLRDQRTLRSALTCIDPLLSEARSILCRTARHANSNILSASAVQSDEAREV